MWRKFVLYLFHENKICSNICNKKYPWSWKSKDVISNYKNLLIKNKNKNNNLDIKKVIVQKNLDEFIETDFLNGSILAYNIIYKGYLDNINFLNYQYTNPKLSIALNEIRNNTSNDLILNLPNKININKYSVLSNVIKDEITTDNFKIFGLYNSNELVQELVTGAIGPEVSHLWDRRPIKQVINVIYESDHYYDILEWERDLLEDNPQWHVSNINKII
tara:strand:+ start:2832 stop:3485 length:654 start_codon:yes stop_codon:yes gene_type:complete